MAAAVAIAGAHNLRPLVPLASQAHLLNGVQGGGRSGSRGSNAGNGSQARPQERGQGHPQGQGMRPDSGWWMGLGYVPVPSQFTIFITLDPLLGHIYISFIHNWCHWRFRRFFFLYLLTTLLFYLLIAGVSVGCCSELCLLAIGSNIWLVFGKVSWKFSGSGLGGFMHPTSKITT